MNPTELLPTAMIVFVMVALVSLIELAVPLFERPTAYRGRRSVNLGMTVLTVVFNWVLTSAAAVGALMLSGQSPGLMTRIGVPHLAQIILGFVMVDFAFGYFAHRAMHWSPTLWRVHRVHHSDPFVDVTTTLRNHPLEGLWRFVCLMAPVWAFGIPAEAVVLHRLLTVFNGTLEHANIRLWQPLDRALSLLWVTPNMHKVHHSRAQRETDSNYGAILAIHDRLFRTFTPTDAAFGVKYGLDDVDPGHATSLRGLLGMPFREVRSATGRPCPARDQMRRAAKVALGLLVLGVGGCLYLNRSEIAVALMRRTAVNTILRDSLATLPDGLHVGFCGTGSPFPSPTRSGPCTAIIAGPRLFVVDAGRGAASIIARMGLPSERIVAVLLTHFHADHIDGLGQLSEMYWLAGSAKKPLLVIGPTGVDRVVDGFNESYALNGSYRIAFDGPLTAAPTGYGLAAQSYELAAGEASTVVLDDDGLRITAFTVNHKLVGPAVGYRFDYKGRSVVVSGDTAKSSNLIRVAAGADILVHEGMSPRLVGVLEEESRASGRKGPSELFHNLQSYHTPPSEAADAAAEAGVGALVFTHLIPPVPAGIMEGPFLDGARDHFAGPLTIAEDGDLISLPSGGGELHNRNLL